MVANFRESGRKRDLRQTLTVVEGMTANDFHTSRDGDITQSRAASKGAGANLAEVALQDDCSQ